MNTDSPAPSMGENKPNLMPDRIARAKKFGWMFFALAVISFLLPFLKDIRNELTLAIPGYVYAFGGQVETPTNQKIIAIGCSPYDATGLGPAVAALLLALTRKPLPSLLAGIAGFAGIVTFQIVQWHFENNATRPSGILLGSGFFLVLVFLTAGTVVQFIIWNEARVLPKR
jgi:hypothetical protein